MAASEDAVMGDLIWRTAARIGLISPCFPRSRGVPRVDDRRIIGGTLNHVEPHFVKARDCIASINWHEEPCYRDDRNCRDDNLFDSIPNRGVWTLAWDKICIDFSRHGIFFLKFEMIDDDETRCRGNRDHSRAPF